MRGVVPARALPGDQAFGLGVDAGLLALVGGDRSRRAGPGIESAAGLGERDDLADRAHPGEQHADPVPTERDAAVWWRAVLERFEQEAELVVRVLGRDAEQVEHPPLHIRAVDTDRAAAD